jgi:hypothetical protein
MEPGQNINRTIVEKSLIFPTVIYTPRYDKRSKSYEFLTISQGAESVLTDRSNLGKNYSFDHRDILIPENFK